MTEFFDQGDKEKSELNIQPQVNIIFICLGLINSDFV